MVAQMTAAEAVAWCRERCIGLELLADGKIKIITDDADSKARAVARLKPVRDEVAALLAAEAARVAPCGGAHCKGCYEIEPGVFMHPPRSLRGDGTTPDLLEKVQKRKAKP